MGGYIMKLNSFGTAANGQSAFAQTKTAAKIIEATTFSYNGRKEMQAHYGLDMKPAVHMELKNG